MEDAIVERLVGRPLTRRVLAEFRTRSLRGRVWFRVLDRMERGLMDLTIRCVDVVRSWRMRGVLLRILEKLVLAMEQGMGRVLVKGRRLALVLSDLAVGWGNQSAYGWRDDSKFQKALGLGLLFEG